MCRVHRSSKSANSYLYNGIVAALISAELEGRSFGEAVLAAASADRCDLLIEGAFTRNRLRQMMFGGATSHITQICKIHGALQKQLPLP
jgi:hypothetical protein